MSKNAFLAKGPDRVACSLVSYCSVTMISQTMWPVKDLRHRCEGTATHSWKTRVGRGGHGPVEIFYAESMKAAIYGAFDTFFGMAVSRKYERLS